MQQLAARQDLLRPGEVAKRLGVSRNRLGDFELDWYYLPGGDDTPAGMERRRRLSPRALADYVWSRRGPAAA